jgi:plasmid stability protein
MAGNAGIASPGECWQHGHLLPSNIVSATGPLCNGFGDSGQSTGCFWSNLGSETRDYAIIDCNAIIDCMASITVRNLKETTKRKLKMRAAANGNSMEQEIREILDSASEQTGTGADLAESIRRRFAPYGGVELEPLPRTPIRDPDIR